LEQHQLKLRHIGRRAAKQGSHILRQLFSKHRKLPAAYPNNDTFAYFRADMLAVPEGHKIRIHVQPVGVEHFQYKKLIQNTHFNKAGQHRHQVHRLPSGPFYIYPVRLNHKFFHNRISHIPGLELQKRFTGILIISRNAVMPEGISHPTVHCLTEGASGIAEYPEGAVRMGGAPRLGQSLIRLFRAC
jgi:hypothetical protein